MHTHIPSNDVMPMPSKKEIVNRLNQVSDKLVHVNRRLENISDTLLELYFQEDEDRTRRETRDFLEG